MDASASILIIDDEDKYLELCRRYMPEHGFLEPARNYQEAAAILTRRRREIDLVLLDVHFDIPDEQLLPRDKSALLRAGPSDAVFERLRRSQGLRILDELRTHYPDLPVIVMTAQDDLPIEADAERLQAEDYTYLLDDEYLDARALKIQVEGILAKRQAQTFAEGPFYWGSTPTMRALERRVRIVSRGQLPLIIQGETGTGKSLIAREFIHPKSRRGGPFIAVDLSTVPSELMGAHLFGVVKGAYTGATASREGVLARAHGGTLFLDEIGNLSLELQKSLLLVLQEGRYRPVGSVEERVADVKLVVATNENLGKMVRDGRFREDLYMRLNPATAVTLPSLRDRKDTFQTLIEFFLRRVCEESYNRDLISQYAEPRGIAVSTAQEEPVQIEVGRKVPPKFDASRVFFLLHPSSFKLLRDAEWPGNFRQFEMVLSNLVTFTLVDLVDRDENHHPQLIPPDSDGARPDVIPISPRTVSEMLRPWDQDENEVEAVEEGDSIKIELAQGESLNAVSCDVERQYLSELYRRFDGDLSQIAELLLGDRASKRKVQLRMNQLGLKLRDLKRGVG